jgi:hypothetical protein
MKPLTRVLIAVATLVVVVAFTAPAPRRGSTSRVDVRNRNSLRIPRLEFNLGGP